MRILGIETSCDETAVAIVEDGRKILSNIVVSQIDIFAAYGGVIPEIAARSHLEAMMPAVHQAFQVAGFTLPDPTPSSTPTSPNSTSSPIPTLPNLTPNSTQLSQTENTPLADWSKIDAIAVTHTPGLLGSLLIGTLTARTLAILHHKPLFPIHHLKSHIYANWLNSSNIQFPLLALVVSGGHTQIIHMQQHNHFEIIGTTRDDAVGECFDKIAKILGLPYPGGPAITQAANGKITQSNLTTLSTPPGNPLKYPFPHPQVPGLDFSFSGLKTAVLRTVQAELHKPLSFPSHQLAPLLSKTQIADFAASFQQTAVDILIEKLTLALKHYPETKSLIIAGGVSANQTLRQTAQSTFSHPPFSLPVFFPAPEFSGDNAAMVGSAAFYEIKSGIQPTDPYHLNLAPRSAIF